MQHDTQFIKAQSAAHSGAFGFNPMKTPTIKMQEAGNYKKGSLRIFGLDIAIENPAGTYRDEGKSWRVADHYGYIKGIVGADGDNLDCFVGGNLSSRRIFVVNQKNRDGSFDEHKVMIGYDTPQQAILAYQLSYEHGWHGLHSIVPMSVKQFKFWLDRGNKSNPVSFSELPIGGDYELPSTLSDLMWTDNEPNHAIDNLLIAMRRMNAHGEMGDLLVDPVDMDDLTQGSEQVVMLDALVSAYGKLKLKMTSLQKAMARKSELADMGAEIQISEPFKRYGSLQVSVLFTLTDGQTVAIFFHNPDTTPNKITPQDSMVSWKWMLNKKDVTIVVSPESGQDISVNEVAMRIMKLAEKNAPLFAKAQARKGERVESIKALREEVKSLESREAELIAEIEKRKAGGSVVTGALPKPNKTRNGSENNPLEIDSDDQYQALGVATITDIDSENVYVEKDSVHYYAKIGNAQKYFDAGFDRGDVADFSNAQFISGWSLPVKVEQPQGGEQSSADENGIFGDKAEKLDILLSENASKHQLESEFNFSSLTLAEVEKADRFERRVLGYYLAKTLGNQNKITKNDLDSIQKGLRFAAKNAGETPKKDFAGLVKQVFEILISKGSEQPRGGEQALTDEKFGWEVKGLLKSNGWSYGNLGLEMGVMYRMDDKYAVSFNDRTATNEVSYIRVMEREEGKGKALTTIGNAIEFGRFDKAKKTPEQVVQAIEGTVAAHDREQRLKSQGVTNQSTEQPVPVEPEPIVITGKELEESKGSIENPKDRANAVFSYYMDKFVNGMPEGVYAKSLSAHVNFDKAGAKKVKSFVGNPKKAKLVVAIDKIIANGRKTGDAPATEKAKAKGVVKAHFLKHDVMLVDEKIPVRLVIHERIDGTFSYDYDIDKDEAVKVMGGSSGTLDSVDSTENSLSVLQHNEPSLWHNLDAFNLSNTLDSVNGSNMVFNLFIEGEEPEYVDDEGEDEPQTARAFIEENAKKGKMFTVANERVTDLIDALMARGWTIYQPYADSVTMQSPTEQTLANIYSKMATDKSLFVEIDGNLDDYSDSEEPLEMLADSYTKKDASDYLEGKLGVYVENGIVGDQDYEPEDDHIEQLYYGKTVEFASSGITLEKAVKDEGGVILWGDYEATLHNQTLFDSITHYGVTAQIGKDSRVYGRAGIDKDGMITIYQSASGDAVFGTAQHKPDIEKLVKSLFATKKP